MRLFWKLLCACAAAALSIHATAASGTGKKKLSPPRYIHSIRSYPPEWSEHFSKQLNAYQVFLRGLTPFNLSEVRLRDKKPNDGAAQEPQAMPSRRKVDRCSSYYNSLYERHNILIRMVYGYMDTYTREGKEKTVYNSDIAETQLLIEFLQKPCPDEKSFACGFEVANADASRYRKSVTGPDGRPRQVFIELIYSSDTLSDVANRDATDPNLPSASQKLRTERAEAAFFGGLAEADVLVYMGHARSGGGPSFEPPKLLLGRAAPVDYAYYDKEKPGFKKMVEALEKSQKPPKILALFSCLSANHFVKARAPLAQRMRNLLRTKNVSFMGTNGMTSSNIDLPNFAGLIDSILGMRCNDGFLKAFSQKLKNVRVTTEGPLP